MRDGRERKEGALVVVGHGGLTSDEVATARKSRKRPHQRLTGCVEATTSKRRSRRSLELDGSSVFAVVRERGDGGGPAGNGERLRLGAARDEGERETKMNLSAGRADGRGSSSGQQR